MFPTKYLKLQLLINRNKLIRINRKIHQINLNQCRLPIATATTSLLNRKNLTLKCENLQKKFSTENESLDSIHFEKVCEETLESLTEYFEELIENAKHLNEADVSYSSGVLTVDFGLPYGIYVINRQSPNKQIWLSSPTSGPKRYNFVSEENCWVYKHDGVSLHQLLQEEITKIVGAEVDFNKCTFSKV
ncbi:frataxin, mitochondrial [Onthophagus taurus]|uniref:frataxin, mitochondrial n=1 Tax=Onthophagus taurus TaxID=166361 RepID=UPI0039BEC7FC